MKQLKTIILSFCISITYCARVPSLIKESKIDTSLCEPDIVEDTTKINPSLCEPYSDEDNTDSLYVYAINRLPTSSRPQAPNGRNEFISEIFCNIELPDSSTDSSIRVFLTFIIEKNGELTNIEIVKGVNTEINSQIIQNIKSSQKWTPGYMIKDLPVRVKVRVFTILRKK